MKQVETSKRSKKKHARKSKKKHASKQAGKSKSKKEKLSLSLFVVVSNCNDNAITKTPLQITTHYILFTLSLCLLPSSSAATQTDHNMDGSNLLCILIPTKSPRVDRDTLCHVKHLFSSDQGKCRSSYTITSSRHLISERLTLSYMLPTIQ